MYDTATDIVELNQNAVSQLSLHWMHISDKWGV